MAFDQNFDNTFVRHEMTATVKNMAPEFFGLCFS